jgi:RimK family alpha-L-glutamate ligase
VHLSIFSREEFLSKNENPDVIIPRLWAKTGEKIINKLEYFHSKWVKIINSPTGIFEAWDKEIFYQKAENYWYVIPQTWNLENYVQQNKNIFFPCVIKLRKSMKGEGVFWIQNSQDFDKFCENFAHMWYENFLIQEYIATSHGKDVRVLMLWHEVLYAMKRTSSNGDFRANIWVGWIGEIFQIDEQTKKMCQKIMKDFWLDFAWIDLLFWEDWFVLCEVNSSPWFEEGEKVSGKDICDELFWHLQKKQKKIDV